MGLPIVGVAVCIGVAVVVLPAPDVTVDIGEPHDRMGVVRFAEERVDVRSGPGPESEVINFLPPALGVLVGEPDANGWVAVLDPVGDTVGFVDASSMMDYPPPSPGRHFELEGLVVPVR